MSGGTPDNSSGKRRLELAAEKQKAEMARFRDQRDARSKIADVQNQVTQGRARTAQTMAQAITGLLYGK